MQSYLCCVRTGSLSGCFVSGGYEMTHVLTQTLAVAGHGTSLRSTQRNVPSRCGARDIRGALLLSPD